MGGMPNTYLMTDPKTYGLTVIRAVGETQGTENRGCLGFCTKPVDEPSKGMKIQGQIVRKQSVTDDFWSTSTCEMDNSALQSHGSVSTLSTSNPPLDPHNSVGSMSNPTEFVNHGLLLWNQTRLQWTGNKRPENQPQIREPKLSWNATYERNGRFSCRYLGSRGVV
ncbi:unnamed protein product [Camellia sinensis]